MFKNLLLAHYFITSKKGSKKLYCIDIKTGQMIREIEMDSDEIEWNRVECVPFTNEVIVKYGNFLYYIEFGLTEVKCVKLKEYEIHNFNIKIENGYLIVTDCFYNNEFGIMEIYKLEDILKNKILIGPFIIDNVVWHAATSINGEYLLLATEDFQLILYKWKYLEKPFASIQLNDEISMVSLSDEYVFVRYGERPHRMLEFKINDPDI